MSSRMSLQSSAGMAPSSSSSAMTARDSFSSRFSLPTRASSVPLSQAPTSSSSQTPPPLVPTAAASGANSISKRLTAIYERPLSKSRHSEVSLSAWAFLFSEMVQYTQKRVLGVAEFEKRLNTLGYGIGQRLLELLPVRDSLYPQSSLRSPPPPSRTIRLLPLLSYIHSTLYRYLFGRPADSLEKSTENDDEYMIGDNDPVLGRSVNPPKEMSGLSVEAILAGIVEGVCDSAGFPAKVTSHSVPTQQHPRKMVLLIKLDPSVLEREKAMAGPNK